MRYAHTGNPPAGISDGIFSYPVGWRVGKSRQDIDETTQKEGQAIRARPARARSCFGGIFVVWCWPWYLPCGSLVCAWFGPGWGACPIFQPPNLPEQASFHITTIRRILITSPPNLLLHFTPPTPHLSQMQNPYVQTKQQNKGSARRYEISHCVADASRYSGFSIRRNFPPFAALSETVAIPLYHRPPPFLTYQEYPKGEQATGKEGAPRMGHFD